MGAFSGACLLGMAIGAVAYKLGDMGALVGAALGLAVSTWLMLRNGGEWAARTVVALTGLAIMMIVCFAFVAFQ